MPAEASRLERKRERYSNRSRLDKEQPMLD